MTLKEFTELQNQLQKLLVKYDYLNMSSSASLSREFLNVLLKLEVISTKEYKLYNDIYKGWENNNPKAILFFSLIKQLYLKHKDIVIAKH